MSKHKLVLAAGAFVVVIFCIASGAIVFHKRTMLDRDRRYMTDNEANPATRATDREQDVMIASASAPITLESGLTTVPLKASRSGESVRQALNSFSTNRNLYLVIGELSAAQQPGVAYHVFLDLPAGVKSEINNPYYVGTVNFYNAVRLEGADTDSKDQRVFSFDITRIVRNLISKGRLSGDTTVTIKAGGVPVDGAQARIGRLVLIAE